MDDIIAYNNKLSDNDKATCDLLLDIIIKNLPGTTCKIWRGHPVWFIDNNPIVGYSALKDSVQLLFWSGQSFDEPNLKPEGTFKAAQARYTSSEDINKTDLQRWLQKSSAIQWDYKDIVKRRGVLERLQ